MKKRIFALAVVSTTLLSVVQAMPPTAAARGKEKFSLQMNVNPLWNAFQDPGLRMIAKEIWPSQNPGMGAWAPSAAAWENSLSSK